MVQNKADSFRLAHVGLFVKDLERSKDFYTQIFGFKVLHENFLKSDDGDIKVAFIALDKLVIEQVEFPKPDLYRKDGYFDHLAFAVKDIDSVVKQLKEKGIQFEADIYTARHFWNNGARWIMFRGPDNEHLELSEIL